jgi:hypothetical protein
MNNKLLLLILSLISLATVTIAKEIDFSKSFQGNNIRLNFKRQFKVDKLILPANNKSIWQSTKSCVCAVAIADNIKRISSINASNTELIFDFEKKDIKQILIKPLVFSDQVITSGISEIKVTGIATQKENFQNNLKTRAKEIIDFQKQNKCFSCHSAIPFSLACEEASFQGLEIPKDQIEVMLEQIEKFQKNDGSYEFTTDPEYGKISTTLSAGFISSTLAKVITKPNPQIRKIFQQLPLWQDKDGSLRHDFVFLPIFNSQITSAFLESRFISNLLYNGISKNEEVTFLYDRLGWLQSWAKKKVRLDNPSDLLFPLGIPYLLQLGPKEKKDIHPKLLAIKSSKAYQKLPEVKIITNFLLNKYFNYKISSNDSIDWTSFPESKKYWSLLEDLIFIKTN